MDILYIVVGLVLFALSFGFVAVCNRMAPKSETPKTGGKQ